MIPRKVTIKGVDVSAATPCVIGNVENVKDARTVESQGADIIEIRCDLVVPPQTEYIHAAVKDIRNNVQVPLVATIRKTVDGGNWYKFRQGDKARLPIFKEIAKYVDGVDIEHTAEIESDVADLFKNKLVILSHHNFSRTESRSEIRDRIQAMAARDCDVIKLAYMNADGNDLQTCFDAAAEYVASVDAKPIAMISMGREGQSGRFLFPFFGSCFTYGCASSAKAPGQPSVKALVQYLSETRKKHNMQLPIMNQANWKQQIALIPLAAV